MQDIIVNKRRWLVLALLFVSGVVIAGCTDVSTQPTYLYGQRPTAYTYPLAPQLSPMQQVEGYFTDPFHWPTEFDPAT